MSILAELAQRILRTKYYQNADLLAQEIASQLLSDSPIVVSSPLILNQTGPTPPLQINVPPTDDTGTTYLPPAVVNVYPSGPVAPPEYPAGTIPFTPATSPPPPPATGGGVGFYGEVVEKVSARVFSINYFDSAGDAQNAEFEMPGMDADGELPAGAPVTVFVYPATNLFITPIWLDP